MFKKIADLLKEQEAKRIAQKCAIGKPKTAEIDKEKVKKQLGLTDTDLSKEVENSQDFIDFQNDLKNYGFDIVIGGFKK
jgi:hypothetical protein